MRAGCQRAKVGGSGNLELPAMPVHVDATEQLSESMLRDALMQARDDQRPAISAEDAKAQMDALKARHLEQLAAIIRAA